VLSATLDDSIEGLLKTYRPLLRPLVRHLSRIIDRFVAISPKLYAENNRYASPEKSVLIPIGIVIPKIDAKSRASARERLSIPVGAPVLVSVGGLCARKDQLFLVQQLPALIEQNPDLLLVLVGPEVEADYAGTIRQYIADHALDAHVRLAGYSEAPWDYYAAADIMVFASHEEGFGTVVIEAQAYGLAVVARHLPGVNDVFVEHGRSGYLFTRGEEFQEHTKRLLSDVALRQRMGASGRDFVAAHYDIADVAARYLALYGFPAEGRG
jgi:glycosyltransferase involved in cell wall biosynthesis